MLKDEIEVTMALFDCPTRPHYHESRQEYTIKNILWYTIHNHSTLFTLSDNHTEIFPEPPPLMNFSRLGTI